MAVSHVQQQAMLLSTYIINHTTVPYQNILCYSRHFVSVVFHDKANLQITKMFSLVNTFQKQDSAENFGTESLEWAFHTLYLSSFVMITY